MSEITHRLTVPLAIVFVTILVLVSWNAFAQTQLVVKEKPIKAQSLAGKVQLGDSREGVRGVLVEDCSDDWKAVLASTHTDEGGQFIFAKPSRNRMHYLRLSFPGANTLLVKVKLDHSGEQKLSLVLAFST